MITLMRNARWPVAFALLLACAACGLGSGTGTLAGSLYIRGCTQDYDYGAMGAPAAYNMNPVYFVANPINALASQKPLHPVNKLELRVQPSGNRRDEADLLYLNVDDDSQVASKLGQPLAVGGFTNVRASLTLRETCPKAEVQGELDGTITFSSFGPASGAAPSNDFRIEFGDRLAASFSFDVVDRRQIALGGVGGVPTTPATGGHIDGSFDFLVRQGKAAQSF